MEFIKTQLQLQSTAKGGVLPYNGMVSGLTYYVRTTGFFSLYRGLAPTLLGSVPKAGACSVRQTTGRSVRALIPAPAGVRSAVQGFASG
jgi:hypothetical protein